MHQLARLYEAQFRNCAGCQQPLHDTFNIDTNYKQALNTFPPKKNRRFPCRSIADVTNWSPRYETTDDVVIECRQCQWLRRSIPLTTYQRIIGSYFSADQTRMYTWHQLRQEELLKLFAALHPSNETKQIIQKASDTRLIAPISRDHIYPKQVPGKNMRLRERLSEAQNHRCAYCQHRMTLPFLAGDYSPKLYTKIMRGLHEASEVTVEHVQARSRSGNVSDLKNLVAACKLCNNARGNYNAVAFYNSLQAFFTSHPHIWKHWHSMTKTKQSRMVSVIKKAMEKTKQARV